jgi:hypothetical protein
MAVTEAHTNFLGIPIEGDIIRGSVKPNQRPIEELAPLFQAAFSHPEVWRIGWGQSTPYFNDGDPCIFSVDEVWADPVGNLDDLENLEDEYDDRGWHDGIDYDKRWGEYPYLGWEGEYPNRKKVLGPYEGEYKAAYDDLLALSEALESEAFDDVLLDKFGDHAKIVVYRDRISVEFYEHD